MCNAGLELDYRPVEKAAKYFPPASHNFLWCIRIHAFTSISLKKVSEINKRKLIASIKSKNELL